eukprot:CCRYP_017202-RA/>CCRYP_017202-RA protein AED:0.33 eAED:0.21 QI:0/0/0/1/1/1/3/0/788
MPRRNGTSLSTPRRIAVNQAVEAIKSVYYAKIEDADEGLNNVLIRDLFEHIKDRYCTITQDEIDRKVDLFTRGIEPMLQLAVYNKKQEDCQEFSINAWVPISPELMVTTGTKHTVNCGDFHPAWREWRRTLAADQTWANWKTDWTHALQENRNIQKITCGRGAFAGKSMERDLANQLVNGLDNLANAAVQKNKTGKKLITMNQQRDKEIASLTKSLEEEKCTNSTLLSISSSAGLRAGGGDNSLQSTVGGKWEANLDPIGFCLLHGYKVKLGHSNDNTTRATIWAGRSTIRIGTRRCDAYEEVYALLQVRGYCPQLHKLDNEPSHNVELFMKENNAKLQYTPPDIHRTSPAERSTRTWKYHFVAIRAGPLSTYRLSNWCKDLEQTDIMLNMLRPCTTNLKLSAYKAMEGVYSFDATPMAPIGTECMIHVKPTQRQTWGYHAMKAWYCAPALNHYQCIKAVTDTEAVRLTDTFKFLHHTLPTPVISDTNRIINAMQQLKLAIEGKRDADEDELEAIRHLQALITGAANTSTIEEPAADNEHEPNTTAPELEQVANPPTEQRYNLQSRGTNIIQATMTTDNNNKHPRPQLFLIHTVLNEESGKILEYRQLVKHPKYKEVWTKSYANELGRLTQGIRDIPGTNTMFFIHKHEIPTDRLKDITFGKIVTNYCPQKLETNRTCLMVVGTYIDYPWDVATPTSGLGTAKLLFNSIISTLGATFLGMDIKNFYLNTPMDSPEYMKLKLDLIPAEIVKKYNLPEKQHNGWVYVRINLGMYGLPQASILANKLLVKR